MPSKAEERWKRLVALLSRPPEVPPRTTRGVGGEAVLRPVRTPSASRCSLGAAPLAFAVCSTPTRVCTRLSLGSLSQRVHPSQQPPLRRASSVASACVSVSSRSAHRV